MPRVAVPPKAPVPAPVGRGKPGGKVAPPPPAAARTFAEPQPKAEEKEVCPLCVEELDETDMSFQPCPCGYRVCLFCFEKLKLHCNSACPNCRRGYGSDEAMQFAKQLEEERLQEALKPKPAMPAAIGPSTALGAATAMGARTVAKTLVVPQARREPHPAAPAARRTSLAEDAAAVQPSLPSGATWGAAAAAATATATTSSPMNMSRHQSVDMERPNLAAMDETSWPSLAASQPAAPSINSSVHHGTANGGQHHHHHHQRHKSTEANGDTATSGTRRSSSIASSSMDRAASSSSLDLMSQDPPVTPEQLAQLQHQHQQYQQQAGGSGGAGAGSAAYAASTASSGSSYPSIPPGFENAFAGSYFGAQVTTTVNGVRRAVNVPVSLGSSVVEPYPEAPAMLASMQQGVASGALSSKDAATQLMSLLQQKEQETQAARARALLAAGKVPPGFGPAPSIAPAGAGAVALQPQAAAPTMRAPPPGFSHLNSTLNPVVPGPASARCTPIQPPGTSNGLGLGGGLGGLGQPLGGGSSLGGATRTYSLWSGLPGIDLGASTGLSSLWQNAPSLQQSSYNPLGFGMDASYQQQQQQQQQVMAKAPPPGFGPVPYQPNPQPQLHSALVSPGDAVLDGAFRSQQSYLPVGSRYNPLGQQAAVGSAYRPPLGTGL